MIAGLLLCALAPGQSPQIKKSHDKPHYAFDETDFIWPSLGSLDHRPLQDGSYEYFLGEPVVVPLKISNHTRFPVTLTTNFTPRSMLKVYIRPEGQRERRCLGPNMPGYYAPKEFLLYSLGEIGQPVIIWSDADRPEKLAFSEPGKYRLRITLDALIPEGSKKFTLTFDPIDLTIVPTPPQFVPLVAELRKGEVLRNLQLGKNPPEWKGDTERYFKQYLGTLFAPYLAQSAANYFFVEHAKEPGNKTAADKALYYLQYAAYSASPFQVPVYEQLLAFFDTLGLTIPAEQTARKMLTIMPPYLLGRNGSDELLQKYLINSDEMDPVKDWALLP